MTTPSQPFGTCAILLNPESKVLLGKRKNSYKAGYFGLPGGRVELNEPIRTAIHREVLEETGIAIENLKYVGVVRENQGETDFIHFVFVATEVTQVPQVCEPDKCEGWQWQDLASINEEVLAGHRTAIELYLQNNIITDITT